MSPASTTALVVECAPQMAAAGCPWPQGELQLPPASLGGSLRSIGMPDSSCFQIIATALGPGMCEFVCTFRVSTPVVDKSMYGETNLN